MAAISLAFEFIEEYGRLNNFVIYTDSLSAIQALQSRKWENPLVQQLLIQYLKFLNDGRHIVLCWVPSHVGIQGNEYADAFAKGALALDIKHDFKVPYTDFYHAIRKYQRQKWQTNWNEMEHNKLKEIKPTIAPNRSLNLSRRDEIVLHRCRIGHSHLTHAYLLKKEDAPFCVPCDCPFTMKHLLVECVDYQHIRDEFYRVNKIEELFQFVPALNVLQFLKESGLFYKI